MHIQIHNNLCKKIKQKQGLLLKQAAFITAQLPRCIREIEIGSYDLEITCREQHLIVILQFLKSHTYTQYAIMTDIIAVDFPGKEERFTVKYTLLSDIYNSRITLVVKLNELGTLPTATSLYKNSGWLEREVWDLMGIFFQGHVDLRRILTDYGFSGHPLRKDFPLTGFYEIYYNEVQKRIVKEPVSLAQEYRNFLFKNPWKK
jgi:NADH:ubiquinone oxidoreductase subunit C